MNILFLTILDIKSFDEKNIYTDLMREFIKNGDSVKIVCPTSGNVAEKTNYIDFGQGNGVLRVKTDKIQKVNLIKKGIGILKVEPQFKSAIKKYFPNEKFDLVLYSTPPITFVGVISFIKKRDNAKSYLLLKDIFPQNAVDIGIMTKSGPKSIIYKYFRYKEKKLYKLSDSIGCMSQANADYVIKHNPYVAPEKVHVNPNSIEVCDFENSPEKRREIREKYNIPQDVTTFVYGGNLGKPQDIPFVIECLKANQNKDDRFFVICGTGTEYPKLKQYVNEEKPNNVLLINGLPKSEYEDFIRAFDVGLIFLDHRFTIPNFPSRLLSYMQNKMPVLACTDTNTDIGKVITDGNFGWWCESDSADKFTETVNEAIKDNHPTLGKNGYEYLVREYTAYKATSKIFDLIKC